MPLSLSVEKSVKEYPLDLLPSLRNIKFVCPKCRGNLKIIELGYECGECEKTYLLHAGIPDFRIFPDPFLTYEEDGERTEIVIAALENSGFEKLLEHYWSFSDITPVALRPKFIRSAILGEQRARQTLEMLRRKIKHPVKKVLEIGCGTGNFLAVASSIYEQTIGIDVAMRWLHLSRRRFMDAKIATPPLVCCNAEFLPFADDYFDLTIASSTLEFVRDQSKVLKEAVRVLNKNGTFYINSVNRFSIAKDPYAYLWGVGFLPRKWQARYVKWRRDASYENVKTLSYREFQGLAKKHFARAEFCLPDVALSAVKEFPLLMRLQIITYQSLKKIQPISFLLKRFGPGWDVILEKGFQTVKKS